jgi:hypothetical protein
MNILKKIHNILNLKFYIACIFLMNLVDSGLTWHWVSNDIAEELNPIMLYTLDVHPLAFFGSKIILTTLGCVLLWRLRSFFLARMGAAMLVGLYLGIMFAHGTIALNIYG